MVGVRKLATCGTQESDQKKNFAGEEKFSLSIET
jgi:hypothetical protein